MNELVKRILDTNTPKGTASLWWLGQMGLNDCETGLVIPGHWDMFADNSADPKEFCDYIEIKYGDKLKSLIPKVMEHIVARATPDTPIPLKTPLRML